ncbi:hypothetical protein [Maribellus sediminis]|uniref:hypothetical protein n=1 Tax=Maribellus sediminis TaxID=2696285 RepID=UPI001431CA10|nr:hypothetical protein [Maribellus sediminis]
MNTEMNEIEIKPMPFQVIKHEQFGYRIVPREFRCCDGWSNAYYGEQHECENFVEQMPP